MSMNELARQILYSKSQVSKIENGLKQPTVMFAKLCDRVLETGGLLTAAAIQARGTVAEPVAEDMTQAMEVKYSYDLGLAELPGRPVLADADAPLLRGVPFGEALTGHDGSVRWGAWAVVGGRPVLATGSNDSTVRLWDPITKTAWGEPLAGHDELVWWGAWAVVGGRPVLATGSSDGTVRLWNPVTGTARGKPLTGHDGLVMWGVWGTIADQAVLATGAGDDAVRLWDPVTGTARGKPLTGHDGLVMWGVWGIAGGRPMLATGGSKGAVRLWDPVTATALGAPLTGHNGQVRWGTWAEMGGRPVLATGGNDSTVRLWDPITKTAWGEPLTGHNGPVMWGVWGTIADQAVLATGGNDSTVRLWDPITATALGAPLTGHNAPVRWGAWAEIDGQPVLATGGDDHTVRLWEVIEDRPVEPLPSYQSDSAGAADALSRSGDAVALAKLITARTARPPLAVGLFGDWGEGKSHFLDLLRQQVRIAARPDNRLAYSAVRQVWFNAWHYAETDLWASLVAELFAQLARDEAGDRGVQQRSQSRLMAEVIAERGLPDRLRAARDRHDELQEAVHRSDRHPLGAWTSLTDEQRQQLRTIAGDRAEHMYDAAIRTGAGLGETGRGIGTLLRGIPKRTVTATSVLLIALVGAGVVIVWGFPAVARWWASLPAAATVATLIAVVVRLRAETAQRIGPVWQAAVRLSKVFARAEAAQRTQLQTATHVAAAEVVALEREMQNLTAAGQLAGFVSDRARGGDYRRQLGVMTEIREDFQHMAALLADTPSDPSDPARTNSIRYEDSTAGHTSRNPNWVADTDAVGDRLPRIDRIVLYIDDLDRCPPGRVVAVLEAIHLLLAIDLFVVVVAVDPRWLLRAIITHYREQLQSPDTSITDEQHGEFVDPDDDELWHSTPAQYLEKIFQVVLTLPPLDTIGYQHLLRTLVGTRPDQPTPEPDDQPNAARSPLSPEPVRISDSGNPAPSYVSSTMFGVHLTAARIVERVDPLTLDADELALLDLLGPPALITTPRAVKRLANSYGLLTALRRDHRAADLAPQPVATDNDTPNTDFQEVTYYPYRAGLVLLAALIAFPALGPALLVHLHRTAAQDPHIGWTTFLRNLLPHHTDGRWANPADPVMTPVQAMQWKALIRGLDDVTTRAADRHLALPEHIAAWAEWAVPVGRLSFPAGRIVSTLHQHQQLATD